MMKCALIVVVITPETPCSRTGSSYIVSGTTSGFLASQTTEDTGCGFTETPWIIQVITAYFHVVVA